MTEESYAEYMGRGSVLVFGTSIVAGIASFLLRIFLARTLSVSDYGLLFAIFSFISFFTVFRHLGLDAAMTKHLSEYIAKGDKKEEKSVLSTVLLLKVGLASLTVAVLAILSGRLSASFFESPESRIPFLIILGWFFVYLFPRYFKKVFQGYKDIIGHSLAGDFIRMIFTFIFLALFFLLGSLDIINASISYLAGVISTTLFGFFLLRKRHPKLFSIEIGAIDKFTAREMLSFGLPLIFSSIAMTFMNQIDTVMLTAFRSLKSVGVYQVARPTTKILTSFAGALGIPLFPMVSELWAKDDKETLRYTLKILSKFSLILILPAIFVFIIFPEEVIRVFYGPEYLGGVMALRILTVSTVFMLGSSIFGSVLTGTGNPRLKLKAVVVAVLFNVFANFLLIPPYGAGGAAIATGSSFLVQLITFFYFTRKIIKFPVPIIDMGKTLVGSLFTLLIVWGLKQIVNLSLWPALFIVMTPSLLFYTLWEFQIGVITKKNITLISQGLPIPPSIVEFLKRLTVK